MSSAGSRQPLRTAPIFVNLSTRFRDASAHIFARGEISPMGRWAKE
jgi:hypothetical protein